MIQGSSTEEQHIPSVQVAGSTPAPGTDDVVMTAVFFARRLRGALDYVPLHPQTRIDMQDFLDMMIQQIRGEL